MKLRRISSALLLSLLLLSCLAGCSGTSDEIRIGTGGTGGIYYAYGTALAPAIEETTESCPATARWAPSTPRPARLL